MLYIIRFAEYKPDMWREEFIGYVFENKPEVQYALCIKDSYQESPFTGKLTYKANTWYAWGETNGAI